MLRRTFLILLLCLGVLRSEAISFALDSISEWGAFPRFVVDTYRWGDGFFNGYDTTYVVGTGYKMNVKTMTDSWINTYRFFLPNNVKMSMRSEPSTSIGAYLTYLAVSAGYDKNVSRFFGRSDQKAREQFSFGFSCMLFSFNMQFTKNTGGVKINSFGAPTHEIDPDILFNGLNSTLFGFDTYYFFNHKRYSQAAAFNFSRIQKKSQGSWFAGVTFSNQNFNFDFSDLPDYMREALPASWDDYTYIANTKNVGLKVGYGYNYVFHPNWLIAFSESPSLGLKIGKINNLQKTTTAPNFSNRFRLSVVWNHSQWFGGLVGDINTAIVNDESAAFENSVFSGNFSFGYRFNLW
ncbi:MAG: DUF4421 domain-containing protein [Muribaculaceae bacterium]|nr:DUF4421 domain-containing protein [Muribaculaceae bacterium]